MTINYWFSTILLWLFTYGFTENGIVANTLAIFLILSNLVIKTVKRRRYSYEDHDQETLKKIESVMREPKGIEITDYEERIRRNLLFSSLLALAFTWLSLSINNDSTFFGGLRFDNITPKAVYWILLSIISYEFIHYVWVQFNNFSHWRIRLTGMTISEVRGDGGPGRLGGMNVPEDYSGRDENSNFYNWMFENRTDRTTAMTELLKQSSEFKELVDSLKQAHSGDSKLSSMISELDRKSKTIEQSTSSLTKAVENIRVNGSMLRFDQWYKILIRSQNARWITLDMLLPFALSLTAIISLICKLRP
ncbi:hypothetical protein ACBZ91_06840 [Vibrio natriegens]|uniref:hypothetical protein n=1 Tax=Vibrio natriegens TaxID=691 RepID=UPI0035567BC1